MTKKVHFQLIFRYVSFLGFLGLATILILWNAALTYTMIEYLHMNDFGKFYFAVRSFFENHTLYEANRATLSHVTPLFAQQFWNLNPPHFYLLIMPLGAFSPQVSLSIWGGFSLISLIACLNMIGNELNFSPTPQQSRLAFLGILAFSGTGAILITGQLTFLLLLPLTLAWIQARKERWARAGVILGLACSIKPFLLIFAPYLILKQQYRASCLFLLTCALIFTLGVVTLGTDTYTQWINTLTLIDWSWAPMNGSISGILDRTLQDNPVFSNVTNAPYLIFPLWVTLSGICGLITFSILHKDRSMQNIDRAFVLLILGATLISPLGWIYYLFLMVGPLTSLTYEWWQESLSTKPSLCTALRNILFLFACGGLIVPIQFSQLLQPNGWATLTLGSLFFWCVLILWIALIFDGYFSNRPPSQLLGKLGQDESNTLLKLNSSSMFQPLTNPFGFIVPENPSSPLQPQIK